MVSCRSRPPPIICHPLPSQWMVWTWWLHAHWINFFLQFGTYTGSDSALSSKSFGAIRQRSRSERQKIMILACLVVDKGDICCLEWRYILVDECCWIHTVESIENYSLCAKQTLPSFDLKQLHCETLGSVGRLVGVSPKSSMALHAGTIDLTHSFCLYTR